MNKAFGRIIPAAFGLTALLIPFAGAGADGVVYIPLGSLGEIARVDTDKDEVVSTVPGLPAVHGLAGTPDGRFLIAGSYEEWVPGNSSPAKPASVSEEDHAAHHGAASATPGSADGAVSSVSVVRTDDEAVVRRIDVPGAVHHVAVSPDGRLAVVTHPNAGTVSAIELDTYNVISTVDTGAFPNYAAFSPDGRSVYVSNAGDGTISVLDTGQWRVEWTTIVGTSPEHLVLSPDGANLFVNNVDDGTVSVIAIDEREVVRVIQIGSTLHGIDLSDDGMTLFVASLGDDKVVAFDLTTGSRRTVRLAPAPYHLAVVRGKNKFYVSSAEEPRVWVLGTETLDVLGEFPISGKGHQMVQGPDT